MPQSKTSRAKSVKDVKVARATLLCCAGHGTPSFDCASSCLQYCEKTQQYMTCMFVPVCPLCLKPAQFLWLWSPSEGDWQGYLKLEYFGS